MYDCSHELSCGPTVVPHRPALSRIYLLCVYQVLGGWLNRPDCWASVRCRFQGLRVPQRSRVLLEGFSGFRGVGLDMFDDFVFLWVGSAPEVWSVRCKEGALERRRWVHLWALKAGQRRLWVRQFASAGRR